MYRLIVLKSLTDTHEKVRNFDETIADLIEREEDLNKDDLDAHMFDKEVKKQKRSRGFIKNYNEDNMSITSNISSKKIGVRLPVITIKPFEGRPINWNPFIEQFNATIDCQEELSDIEKFTYLRGFLKGDALQTIEGLSLTNQNNTNAKDLLKARYGNPQLIISSHMNNLIQLGKLVGADVRKLRLLYDKIEANVRALNSVGIESKHFGALLIPIVLQKLPNVIKLQISRQLGTGNWNIKEFLKCLSKEISARESYELSKGDREGGEFENNGRKVHEYYKKKGTLSSLDISHSNTFCVFCGDEHHYSDKCDAVTEFEARKEKLKKEKENYCFKCLRRGT